MVAELAPKLKMVRFVLTDVDGVLTDGGVYYGPEGEVMKRFSIRDGEGVNRLRRFCGVPTGIITGELSPSVKRRAEKLKIEHVFLGARNKIEVFESLKKQLKLPGEAFAYIGDDAIDLEVMARVGLSACPADALPFVQSKVDFKCTQKGGYGAFREVAEAIIAVQCPDWAFHPYHQENIANVPLGNRE